MKDPFAALRLEPSAELTDAQVRAAWQEIARDTHPDRPDGGDPAAFAAASAAYDQLRTPFGRSEAAADLKEQDDRYRQGQPPLPGGQESAGGTAGMILDAARVFPARIRHGNTLRIAVRAVVAALVAYGAVIFAAGTPAAPAVAWGCAVWFTLTARYDLAPPPGR